jgi:hypothetical protein
LERGRVASIDIVLLERIARACSVSVRCLSGGGGEREEGTRDVPALLTRQIHLLEELLRRVERLEARLDAGEGEERKTP